MSRSQPCKEPLSQIDQRLLGLLIQARARDRLFPAPAQTDGPPTTIVVAVSGGADSVTLLHLLTRMREPWSLHLVVAHLDHSLRPESVDDARFVAELAAQWALPLVAAKLPPDALAQGGNLEAAARRARYQFLAQVAVEHQIDGHLVEIAVAHTANDQAETVLMNLIRGSGLDGLAGMQPLRPLFVDDRPVPGVRVVRPLLDASRTDILRYLNKHRIPWRQDPTNQDQTFVRNRVRHDILPRMQEINPQIVTALCRTASILAAEAQRADTYSRQALRATQKQAQCAAGADRDRPDMASAWPAGPSNRQIFNLAAFRSLGVAAQRALLRAAGLCLGQPPVALSFDVIERIRQTLSDDSGAGGPYSWVGDLMLTRAHDTFSLHHRGAEPYIPDHPYLGCSWLARHGSRTLPVPGEIAVGDWVLRSELLAGSDLPENWLTQISPWEAYLDAGKVGELALSAPQPGQRFEPLGLNGHGKALADYFTDRKVPRSLRRGWPIVLDGAEIVWVGGRQIADRVRITNHSQEILHLYWVRYERNHTSR